MTSERLDLAASIDVSDAAVTEQRVAINDDTMSIVHADAAPASERWRWYTSLKAHRKTWMAISGFREVLLIAGVYSMYDMTRFLVAGESDVAFAHGRSLLHFEQRIAMDPEHALNRLFNAHMSLGLTADYMYATLHYIVTPVVLIWMWRRHGSAYSQARSVLMVATILGLVGYSLLPVAPPRLLPGFVDTMAKLAHYGWWGNAASAPRGLGGDTNQFAALPSLHVGWALWCGWQLARYSRHRVIKVLGVAYPIVVTLVVMGTANHYLIDAVAGVGAVLLATLIVRGLTRIGIVKSPEETALPSQAKSNAVTI